MFPLVPCRSSVRRCEAKAQSSSTSAASGSWPRFQAPSLRRATWSRARFGACASQAAAPSSTRAPRSAKNSPTRFPAIAAACHAAGIDPAREPIPVRPAQHYHMGGIAVDAEGRSSVAGLWACGEAASTGLHGANRLASNSLAEAAVDAAIVARSIDAAKSRALAPPRYSVGAGRRRSGAYPPDPLARRGRRARRRDARRRRRPACGDGGRERPRRRPGRRRAHDRGCGAPPRAQPRRPLPRPISPRRLQRRVRSRLTLDEAFAAAAAYAPPVRIRRA